MNGRPSLLMVSTVPVTLQGFLLPIVSRMRAAGWRIDGAASGISASPMCVDAFDRVWDVDWSRDPSDPSNLSTALRRMREVVTEGGHDVVHVHTPVAAFVTRVALRSLRAEGRCRVAYTAHGFHFHERNSLVRNLAFLTLEKLAGRWTDRLVLINEYDVDQALKHAIVPPEHVVYMRGIGIDTRRFDPAKVHPEQAWRVRRELGLSGSDALFLVPAEFIARKRQDLVVKALELIGRDDVHVVFVGEGPTRADVEMKVREAGLTRVAHFLGWRDDMPEQMRAATATLLYSSQEGLSRAVMESLAMECPVIGSDIRGIRELVADGCGIAVDPDRFDLLAQAMVCLADDPQRAAAMGRAGRLKMSGPYEERRIVAEHQALYDGLYEELAQHVASAAVV